MPRPHALRASRRRSSWWSATRSDSPSSSSSPSLPCLERRLHSLRQMCSPPAFVTSSSFVLNRFRPASTCRNVSASRVAILRLRATATDPERPKNVQASDPPPPPEPTTPPEPATPPEPVTSQESQFEEQVPGKIQLDEIALAKQRTALEEYSRQLREKRLEEEREAARLFGFVPYAETLNGRLAMFFIVTGLLTEYWTGYTLPEQVELMLRTLGIL